METTGSIPGRGGRGEGGAGGGRARRPEGAYSAEEQRAILRALRERRPSVCPSCGQPLTPTAVPPKPEVAYVRDRIWILCGSCGRSLVVDRRELGQPPR